MLSGDHVESPIMKNLQSKLFTLFHRRIRQQCSDSDNEVMDNYKKKIGEIKELAGIMARYLSGPPAPPPTASSMLTTSGIEEGEEISRRGRTRSSLTT